MMMAGNPAQLQRTKSYSEVKIAILSKFVLFCLCSASFSDLLVLTIGVGVAINVFTVKWYKLTPWDFTAFSDWLREHNCLKRITKK